MGKGKFLLRKLAGMDYAAMLDTAKKVRARSGKSLPSILLDMARCGARYQAGYRDYYINHMESLPESQRALILTAGKNNEYVRTLNDPAYRHILSNKAEFNQTFAPYLGRRWIFITGENEREFCAFCENLTRIVVKPLDLSCGKGVEILPVQGALSALYRRLTETGQTLCEEVLTQHPALNALYPHAINTLRAVTVLGDGGSVTVVGTYLRIGTGGNVVDNFHHGGIAAPVDRQTGEIVTPARNHDDTTFTAHPDTGTPIVGFRYPCWEETLAFIRTLATVVPQVRYVGWDICLTENGPAVVEGNEYPTNDLFQDPAAHIGTADCIEEALHR